MARAITHEIAPIIAGVELWQAMITLAKEADVRSDQQVNEYAIEAGLQVQFRVSVPHPFLAKRMVVVSACVSSGDRRSAGA